MKGSMESHQDATIDDEQTSIENSGMLGLSDGDNRDGMEPMGSGVGVECLTMEINYSPTATETDSDSDSTPDGTASEMSDDGMAPERSDDGIDVAHPVDRYPTELSFTASHSDHRAPSTLDADALAADPGYYYPERANNNSFVNDPGYYRGVASNDDLEVADWANDQSALSDRSEPPSRASSASPTLEQSQFRYGAMSKFENDQAVDGPYNHLGRDRVPASMANFLAAASAAGAGPWRAQ